MLLVLGKVTPPPNAHCTLAETTSQISLNAVRLAIVNGFLFRQWLSGSHRETLTRSANQELQRVQCNSHRDL